MITIWKSQNHIKQCRLIFKLNVCIAKSLTIQVHLFTPFLQVVPAVAANGIDSNREIHYATLAIPKKHSVRQNQYRSSTIPRSHTSAKTLIRSQSGTIPQNSHTPKNQIRTVIMKVPGMPSIPVVTPRLPQRRQPVGVPTVLVNGENILLKSDEYSYAYCRGGK